MWNPSVLPAWGSLLSPELMARGFCVRWEQWCQGAGVLHLEVASDLEARVPHTWNWPVSTSQAAGHRQLPFGGSLFWLPSPPFIPTKFAEERCGGSLKFTWKVVSEFKGEVVQRRLASVQGHCGYFPCGPSSRSLSFSLQSLGVIPKNACQ